MATAEWISWEKFKRDEGEAVCMELIRSKKILFRLHEKLQKDTTIPFPQNQQFRQISKVDRVTNSVEEGGKMEGSVEAGESEIIDFNAIIKQCSDSVSTDAIAQPTEPTAAIVQHTEKASASGAQKNIQVPSDPDVEKVITAIRKAVSEWDRKRRELSRVMVKSLACENTKGTAFEKQLEAAMTQGDEMVDKLEAIENKNITGVMITNEDKVIAAATMDSIFKLCKRGSATATLLNTLINAK